jgi:phosphatidylglycerophosphate synthase
VLGSFFPEHGLVESLMERGLPTVEETMEPDGTCGGGCAFVVPDNLFLAEVEELASGEGDRKLLQTVGKPTDRWHVVWIRNRTFGVMRWLAARAVTPNQISVAGFFVAVLACVVIASGGYLRGVAGAVLLYASWVLDCMDGTLARLTFAESTFGRKLDTILGHLANLSTFGALIWAAYGEQSPLEAVFFGFLILGGILVAHRLSEEDKRTRPAKVSATDSPRLTAFLDKINHRDYAVIVLVLALADGFKIFVWLSAIGVQVFWLTELWLILARSGAAPASKSTPSRLFP